VKINRVEPILWVLAGLVAWGLARTFLLEGFGLVTGLFGAILLAILVFKIDDKMLPVLVLITLSLGSSYRAGIAQKTFYLRFFLLAVVALRGGLLMVKDSSAVNHGARRAGSASYPLVLVGLFGLVGSFWSVDPGISAQRSLTFLLLLFVIFGFFRIHASTTDRISDYAIALWRGMAIILVVGFGLLALGAPGMFVAGRLRLIVGNPNQLGHYCVLMAPIAVWYAFSRSRGLTRRIAWLVLAFLGVALLWSGSRGGLVAGLSSVGLLFALAYRERAMLLLLIGSLLLSIHFLIGTPKLRPGDDPSFFQETIVREYSLESGSGRTGVWKSAGHLIGRRPFFGYGFAVTDRLFKLGYFSELPIEFQGGHVHNGYIEELVNLGWVGASPIFLAILYLLISGLVAVSRPAHKTPSYQLTCALVCTILGGALSGIFESWFTSVGSTFCFPFWLTGMLLMQMVARSSEWKNLPATTFSRK
jgi:O-antigen ligase